MPDETSSYLDRLMAHILPAPGPSAGDTAEAGAALLARQAVTELCWAAMTYRCDACGFQMDIWLSLGCEGPPTLKDRNLYVPVPFSVGCPAWPAMEGCPGNMQHIDWSADRHFTNPVVPPDDVARFVLPDPTGTAGRLFIPVSALVAARRFHNEPQEGA